jgi:phosphoribosylglycinamide formyltransferase-1
MIVALCSGQGRTFTALHRVLGERLSDLICDVPTAPVLQRAQELQVPAQCVSRNAFVTRAEHESAILAALGKCKPFAIVALLGYMRILSSEFLSKLQRQWPQAEIINLHPAPLSLYKGAHGLRHAIDCRAPRWGISVHRVTPELDAGPLLSYQTLEVRPTDAFETLRERAHPLEVTAVLDAINKLLKAESESEGKR